MPRRERFDFPGAFFHITSRGNRKQPVFLSDDDRFYFLSCLREVHEKHGVLIHVYCLMENHYHLFLETPRAGLSRAMHLVNMRYSNYFNLKHGRCGHTFQSRYKAILVEAAAYARELAAYVHLNPVRAGIVRRPEEYDWTNYRAFIGLEVPQNWTVITFILGLFGASMHEAMRAYESYVLSRQDKGLPDTLKEARRKGILGGPEFIDRISETWALDAANKPENAPRTRPPAFGRPSMETIIKEMEGLFGLKSRMIRKMAIYFTHMKTDYTLKEIGGFFGIGGSGITDICRRLNRELVHNKTLARTLDEVEKRLKKELEGTGFTHYAD